MLMYPPAAVYLDAAGRLSTSSLVIRLSPFLAGVNNVAAGCFLPLLVLFLAGMISVAFQPSDRRRSLWVPGVVLLLICAVLFGNCLTVAVVHSFDIERYSFNLLFYTVLCELAAAVWLYELVWAWVGRETAPHVFTPAATIPFIEPPPATVPTVREP